MMKKKPYSKVFFSMMFLVSYSILYMSLLRASHGLFYLHSDPLVSFIANTFFISKVTSAVIILYQILTFGLTVLVTTKTSLLTSNRSINTFPRDSYILVPVYLLYSFAWFLVFLNILDLIMYGSLLLDDFVK